MIWSYSRIKAFEDCPYRWYLKYVFFDGKIDKVQDQTFFAQYGVFVHKILSYRYSGKITASEALEMYIRQFPREVYARAPNFKIYTSYYNDGLKAVSSGLPFSEDTPVLVEAELRWSIGDTPSYPFIGYVDFVPMNGDGDIIVVDHKSRKLAQYSTRKTPTKNDRDLDEFFRQLYLYCRPVSEVTGVTPKGLTINSFRVGELISVEYSEGKRDQAEEWAVDKIRKIESEDDFSPDPDWFKCKYLCEMHSQCEYYKQYFGR